MRWLPALPSATNPRAREKEAASFRKVRGKDLGLNHPALSLPSYGILSKGLNNSEPVFLVPKDGLSSGCLHDAIKWRNIFFNCGKTDIKLATVTIYKPTVQWH